MASFDTTFPPSSSISSEQLPPTHFVLSIRIPPPNPESLKLCSGSIHWPIADQIEPNRNKYGEGIEMGIYSMFQTLKDSKNNQQQQGLDGWYNTASKQLTSIINQQYQPIPVTASCLTTPAPSSMNNNNSHLHTELILIYTGFGLFHIDSANNITYKTFIPLTLTTTNAATTNGLLLASSDSLILPNTAPFENPVLHPRSYYWQFFTSLQFSDPSSTLSSSSSSTLPSSTNIQYHTDPGIPPPEHIRRSVLGLQYQSLYYGGLLLQGGITQGRKHVEECGRIIVRFPIDPLCINDENNKQFNTKEIMNNWLYQEQALLSMVWKIPSLFIHGTRFNTVVHTNDNLVSSASNHQFKVLSTSVIAALLTPLYLTVVTEWLDSLTFLAALEQIPAFHSIEHISSHDAKGNYTTVGRICQLGLTHTLKELLQYMQNKYGYNTVRSRVDIVKQICEAENWLGKKTCFTLGLDYAPICSLILIEYGYVLNMMDYRCLEKYRNNTTSPNHQEYEHIYQLWIDKVNDAINKGYILKRFYPVSSTEIIPIFSDLYNQKRTDNNNYHRNHGFEREGAPPPRRPGTGNGQRTNNYHGQYHTTTTTTTNNTTLRPENEVGNWRDNNNNNTNTNNTNNNSNTENRFSNRQRRDTTQSNGERRYNNSERNTNRK